MLLNIGHLIWKEKTNSQVDRIKRSPFRLSFIRWYELLFVILFSLFTNVVTTLKLNLPNFWLNVFAILSLFCSALSSFNIFRIMDEVWREVTMKGQEDPINGFYKSFGKDDEKKLWFYFFITVISFLIYIFLSIVS